MSQRWIPLLLLLLLLTPSASAHGVPAGSQGIQSNGPARPAPEPPLPEGYTGPGREPYLSYFQGVWMYGALTVTPLKDQRPIDMDVDGDWVVWTDANTSDIYVFSISAGQGYYLTDDRGVHEHPHVSKNVVVFQDQKPGIKPAVYASFLDTGETRRLSGSNQSVRDPSISYPIAAWVDENVTNPDIWAYSFVNNTAWPIHANDDRDSNPVVIGERVFWRTYRYNVWDVMGYDTSTGEEIQVTTDAAIQSAPFSNGSSLLYLSEDYERGWTLDHYDPALEKAGKSTFTVADTRPSSASGEVVVRLAQDTQYAQIVVRNLTSGAVNHVTGDLYLTTTPAVEGRAIFAAARTKQGTSLLELQVSPFALSKAPTVTILSPGDRTAWLRPLSVQGILKAGPGWTEPTTFTYRLDDQAPQIIAPGERWKFTLDPQGVEPGAHVVTIRATFREGPPVTTSLQLAIPAPSQGIDVARVGPAFHAARLIGEVNLLVVDNPAAWFLIPLVLIILALLIFRLVIWLKPRRKRSVVEYVFPDADPE